MLSVIKIKELWINKCYHTLLMCATNYLLQQLQCSILIYNLFKSLTLHFIIINIIIKFSFLVCIAAGPSNFCIFLHSAVQWFCNTSLFTWTATARTDATSAGNLRYAMLTVVLFINQVNVYIFTVNIKKYLELCMVTSLQDGWFNFWEKQENFLKIPVFWNVTYYHPRWL